MLVVVAATIYTINEKHSWKIWREVGRFTGEKKSFLTNINKTGMSQVGAISKVQIKSKGGQKNSKKKLHSVEKKSKGGPFSPVRFCWFKK